MSLFLFSLLLLTFIAVNICNALDATRGVIQSVPEHNSIYDGGVLYRFWISYGVIVGDIYGINNSYGNNNYTFTKIRNETELLTPMNGNETCISVDVDYLYDEFDTSLMYTPINLILTASCRYCYDSTCDWRILLVNIDGDNFNVSPESIVGEWIYDANKELNEIMVNVQRFGDAAAVSFNAVTEYGSDLSLNRTDPLDTVARDVVLYADYDYRTLTFVGYNGTRCTRNETTFVVECNKYHFKQYRMLSSYRNNVDNYTYPISLYSTSSIINFLDHDNLYWVECHSEIEYVLDYHSIQCTGYLNGEFSGGITLGSATQSNIIKNNVTLTDIDNKLYDETNNERAIKSDISWLTHLTNDEYGKFVVVFEKGDSVYGTVYHVINGDVAPIFALQSYLELGDIPNNTLNINMSYNPVVTSAPIKQDITNVHHGKYIVCAWAVKQNGIYASIFNGNGIKVGYSKYNDIEIYKNINVDYTWLDIECINNAIYVSFIITDSNINSILKTEIIYITDYVDLITESPTTHIPTTNIPTTYSPTTYIPTASIVSNTIIIDTTSVILTTNDEASEEIQTTNYNECLLEFELFIKVNTTSIGIEIIQQDNIQQIFIDTFKEELMKNIETISNEEYTYNINDIDSSIHFGDIATYYIYDFDSLFCIIYINEDEDEDNMLYNQLTNILNSTIFWEIDVEDNLNLNNNWPDNKTVIQLTDFIRSNNIDDDSSKIDDNKFDIMLIYIIIGATCLLLLICISLFIFWYCNISQKQKSIAVAEQRISMVKSQHIPFAKSPTQPKPDYNAPGSPKIVNANDIGDGGDGPAISTVALPLPPMPVVMPVVNTNDGTGYNDNDDDNVNENKQLVTKGYVGNDNKNQINKLKMNSFEQYLSEDQKKLKQQHTPSGEKQTPIDNDNDTNEYFNTTKGNINDDNYALPEPPLPPSHQTQSQVVDNNNDNDNDGEYEYYEE